MKWKILPNKNDDLVEQLLINRGIKTEKEREQFFHGKLSDFENDLKISGIEKAQKRILKAIKNNELIIVYGDYDVDGICGSAILYKALTSIGAKVLPYIPHREKEGYGLSKMGLESVKKSGASLVITVDNGISANKQADFAKEIGLDLIITDHHSLPLKKPEAFAIVHSLKMCGAAVAWCLVRKIISEALARELLQFVALATVCDLMTLQEVNRAFLVEGLKILNSTTNLGLLSLINECGISLGEISSYEIGHILGPRLNAMGRLEHAIDSLRLLCTRDPMKAKKLSKLICETNSQRQQITTLAIEEASKLIVEESRIHVLYSKNWSAGIIGLLAGKITETYFRPSIAISFGKEVSKGSARSINGINIVELIRKHSDILIDVGGHPGAAGFSILSKNIERFKKRLEKEEIILPEEKVLEIDAEVYTKKLSKSLVESLEKFAPFGFGNPRPVFATYNMKVSDVRTVGEGKHLKFKADRVDAIAFGMGDQADDLKSYPTINLAYNLEINKFNDSEILQLKVKDIS